MQFVFQCFKAMHNACTNNEQKVTYEAFNEYLEHLLSIIHLWIYNVSKIIAV